MLVIPTSVPSCAYGGDAQTSSAGHWSPFTTMKAELKIRQTTSSIGTNTCGWIEGNPESIVTCPSPYACGVVSTFVGCSPTAIYTSCYDRLGPTCDQDCQQVLANLYCGNDYCAQFNYPSGSVGYGCATVSGYTNTVLLTTTQPATTSALGGIGSASNAPVTITTTPAPSSSTASATSSSNDSLSSGAIAGIVIGSVAVIAFICGLAFMIWAHRKKQRKSQDIASRESAMSLNPSVNGPSTPNPQVHSGHLSGSTFYENADPPFNPGDGPWSTAAGPVKNSAKPPEELEADYPHEKDGSEYNPHTSTRFSELSSRS